MLGLIGAATWTPRETRAPGDGLGVQRAWIEQGEDRRSQLFFQLIAPRVAPGATRAPQVSLHDRFGEIELGEHRLERRAGGEFVLQVEVREELCAGGSYGCRIRMRLQWPRTHGEVVR